MNDLAFNNILLSYTKDNLIHKTNCILVLSTFDNNIYIYIYKLQNIYQKVKNYQDYIV